MRRLLRFLGSLGICLLCIVILIAGQVSSAAVLRLTGLQEQSITFGALLAIGTIGLVTAMVWLLRRFGQKLPMATLGLSPRPGWTRAAGAGFLAGTLGILAVFGVEWALGWARLTELPSPGVLVAQTLPAILASIMMGLSPGYCEELLFRGVMFDSISRVAPRWLAAVLPAVLFAGGHFSNGGFNLRFFAFALLFSLFQTWVRLRTDTLWWAIGCHAAWDWAQRVVGLSHPGQPWPGTPGLLIQSGPAWAVGVAPSIEGGLLVSGAGLALVVVLGAVYVRRQDSGKLESHLHLEVS